MFKTHTRNHFTRLDKHQILILLTQYAINGFIVVSPKHMNAAFLFVYICRSASDIIRNQQNVACDLDTQLIVRRTG